jgi:AhpD family alkylhydroperoxidase
MTMKPRMNFYQAAPDTIKALSALETPAQRLGVLLRSFTPAVSAFPERVVGTQVQGSGLEQSLIELVKTRASQINGCAFCINMHTQDARKHGETEQRLYLLNAWREAPLYADRERAALAWTEAVTLISETHAPDDSYNEVRKHFSEAETVNLTMLIATIKAWNRPAISFRAVPPAGVSRHSLTDRLCAQLGKVEQDRDQDDREHVAASKGDAGRDENGLQGSRNREKL